MKTSKASFIHSVFSKITILAIVSLCLVASLTITTKINYEKQNKLIYNTDNQENKITFNTIIAETSRSVDSMAADYSWWDDMVAFAKNPKANQKFAETNLISDVLATYKVDSLRIYQLDSTQIAAVDADPSKTATFKIDGNIKELFNGKKEVHYYTKYADNVMEVFGYTIQPSNDPDRKTPDQGYLFTTKLIDNSYLNRISASSQNTVELIYPENASKYPTSFTPSTGRTAFKQNLTNADNQTIAQFYVTHELPSLQQTSSIQQMLLYLMISTYIGVAALIIFVSFKWVLIPLKKISKALDGINNKDSESLKDIYKIAQLKTEFGQLARAVMNHAWQQKQLEIEKNSVEEQVAFRTNELQEERARLRDSIESLNVGYFMTDKSDHIMIINKKAEDILRHAQMKDIKDNSSWTVKQIEDCFEHALPLQEELQKCYQSNQVFEHQEVNFDHLILKVYIAPIVKTISGEPKNIGALVLLEDITEARIFDRSKDEFFSIASHELRTPLTAIRGNTKMIMDYYTAMLKDKNLDEMVADIHDSSIRLIEIVNDFLDISSLEQDKMTFKPESFDITKVLETITYEMKGVLTEKNIYLKLDNMVTGALPNVYADQARVKQVLYNLIGNSIKYTDTGGITVSTKVEDSFLKVIITDTGKGIPEKSKELLFRKFQQVSEDLLTRDVTRGTGLGLYISRLLVGKMGGEIKLEYSEPEKGSSFSFTLPLDNQNISNTSPNTVSEVKTVV